jgi:hypothetical protein
MKKILTLICFLFSTFAYSQTEQDFQLFTLVNEERIRQGSGILYLYDNYTDFEYFVNYSLRVKDTSDKEIKKSVNYINDFIGVYYSNATRVYYAAVCSYNQPTPQSLLNNLTQSNNLPEYESNYLLPKIIIYRVSDKWIGFIYLLTFDL